MEIKSLSLIDQAIILAAKAHRNQSRKGTRIPYITHPFGVAVLLCRAGCSDEVVIAGILHDTMEDGGVKPEKIRKEFGDRVLSLVEACTEPDKSLSWEKRKEHTIEYLKGAPLDVKFVVVADKLNNIRAISADFKEKGDKLWKRFSRGKEDQKWYYQRLVKALRDNSGNEPYEELYRQFKKEVKGVFGA